MMLELIDDETESDAKLDSLNFILNQYAAPDTVGQEVAAAQ